MANDLLKIEDINRMLTPAGVLVANKLKKSPILTEKLLDILYGGTGAYSSNGFINSLNALKSGNSDYDFSDLMTVYADTAEDFNPDCQQKSGKNSKFKFNNIVKPDENNRLKLCVLSRTPFISPAVRNTTKVETFLNFIPTVVASELQLYFDAQIVFQDIATSEGDGNEQYGKLRPPGLFRFLLGAEKTQPDMISDQVGLTQGMEMFTAPQTLQNLDRRTSLDPFRPLLTFESFTVTETPTVGMYTYKKADMKIVLHDRTRLHEIAEFLKPELYQQSKYAPTFWITYGWRLPQRYDVNVQTYEQFINSTMLTREAYRVHNSQYQFSGDGKVNITLNLHTECIHNLRLRNMNEGKKLNAFNKMKELSSKIATIIESNSKLSERNEQLKELRPIQLLDAASNMTYPDLDYDKIRSTIKEFDKSLSKTGIISREKKNELIELLNDYYHKTGNSKEYDYKKNIATEAAEETKTKLKDLIKIDNDPFLWYVNSADEQHNDLAQQIKKADTKSDKKNGELISGISSFGKIMSTFMSELTKMDNNINELQLFFYQFNDAAGAAANTNIAEFPIDLNMFSDKLRETYINNGSQYMTYEEFFRLLVDSQLNDMRSVGYGFREYFKPYIPGKSNDAELDPKKQQGYENKLAGYDGSKTFKKPEIEMYVETLHQNDNARNSTDLLVQFQSQVAGINGSKSDVSKTIVRVHIFDKVLSPIPEIEDTLAFDRGQFISFETRDERTNYILGTSDPFNDVNLTKDYSYGLPVENIKRNVSALFPTILFGSNGSMIKEATLSSQQDQLLATVQMQKMTRDGQSTGMSPNGGGIGGLPVSIIPAKLSMTSVGCPLLKLAQQYFIDFSTGTTADALYILTNMTHTISQGKYESSLQFSFTDGYARFRNPVAHTIDRLRANLETISNGEKT